MYLTIEILAHPFFRFEGDDLVCDVPIRPDEAVLGAEISVPTPDGSVTMKVPKGVRSGQLFGPGEAKNELKQRLEVNNLGGRIVGIETVDKMTEPQIAAKIRQHFAE